MAADSTEIVFFLFLWEAPVRSGRVPLCRLLLRLFHIIVCCLWYSASLGQYAFKCCSAGHVHGYIRLLHALHLTVSLVLPAHTQ